MRRSAHVVAVLAWSLAPSSAQAPPADVDALAAACNRFAAALHAELAAKGEPTVSPVCLWFAMGTLWPVARGDTAAELARALALPQEWSEERLFAAMAALRGRLPTVDAQRAAALRLVNDVWTAADVPARPGQAARLARLGATLHMLPFAQDPEAARTAINAHVAKATNGRIAEVIAPHALAADTGVVVTSAMWFTASWVGRFWGPASADGAFTLADGRKITVRLMAQEEALSYAESDAWQFVRKPLEGGFAVEFVLPRPGMSLPAAERALLDGSAAARAVEAKVDLRLPRFEVGGQVPVRAALEALGARTAFTPQADFTGMSPTPVRLDQVALRTVFRVDEQGVEGGAAAVARGPITGQATGAVERERKTFHAVRPFAFVVREQKSGLILFVGRVDDPRPR